VLGEMAELGVGSAQAHLDLGAACAAAGVDRILTVGPAAAGIADGAIGAGVASSNVVRVGDSDDAARLLEAELHPGDVVLVKASRSAQLDRVAAHLLEAGLGSEAGA
jgi:UDP-N-acetylmuramoyl-tripeptide--D-alanyl-D-alanine ligase